MEIFESVNPNNLAVTNIALSGDYVPLTETYAEAAALANLSDNTFLLTDIDQSLYKVSTTGVLTFVASMDHLAKGAVSGEGVVVGGKEIGIGGIETKGLLRGPAYQIFESNGTLLQTQFVLNPDF